MTQHRPITIREAGEADLPTILQLYAQPEIDDGKILPLNVARSIFRQFRYYPNYTLFVAERDNRIAGSYVFLVMHNLGHLGVPSAIVDDVVVGDGKEADGARFDLGNDALRRPTTIGCSGVNVQIGTHRTWISKHEQVDEQVLGAILPQKGKRGKGQSQCWMTTGVPTSAHS